MNLLRAEGLTKSYGKRIVVNQVSFEINDGEIVGLLGQNGAGKSTSFNMIIGTIQPDSG
ncbi:MAG: ATP-binding cassette domain-containing protein, partial [Candidatus Jettenia caeni]|nr:ATP-binding cassette domain-containing protein [Candidatus Jettenia caeni]